MWWCVFLPYMDVLNWWDLGEHVHVYSCARIGGAAKQPHSSGLPSMSILKLASSGYLDFLIQLMYYVPHTYTTHTHTLTHTHTHTHTHTPCTHACTHTHTHTHAHTHTHRGCYFSWEKGISTMNGSRRGCVGSLPIHAKTQQEELRVWTADQAVMEGTHVF